MNITRILVTLALIAILALIFILEKRDGKY